MAAKMSGLDHMSQEVFNPVPFLAVCSSGDERTNYACDGTPLRLLCGEDEVIRITRANYGRFSIALCNDEGRTDWSVNCFASKSFGVLSER